MLFKDPAIYLKFIDEILNDSKGIGEIAINFILGEANVVGIVGIPVHVNIVLSLIILKKVIHVFRNFVFFVVIGTERL